MGNVDTSDCFTEAERNQILNSQKAPYISPVRSIWCLLWEFGEGVGEN